MKKNAELVFKIAYLLLVLLSFNVFFARHWYMTYVSYAVIAFGMVVGVLRLLHIKEYLNVSVFLLLSFTCSYILGAVNSFEYGYTDNIKAVVWMAIQYFLIFAFDENEDYSNERDTLFKVFLTYTGIAAVISLWMMIIDWKYYSFVDGIYWVFGGFIDNRLWGCYTDPNYGAILAIVSAIISLKYLLEDKQIKKPFKALLIVNIVFEFLYVCYSDSRTGLLAIVASVIVLVVVWLSKTKGLIKTVALSIAIVAVIIGAIYAVRFATSEIKVQIAKISATRAGMTQDEIAAEMDLARVGREDDQIGEGKDVTNNRIAIWKNAITIFRQHPIIGISYRNIREYALDNIRTKYAGFESMHNFFFDVLVSQGIVGVIILFMLIAWVLWTLIKKYKSLSGYREFAFMLAIIAAIFASMLTYSETFYMNTGGAFLFWYVLGYLVNFKNKDNESIEEKV